jgi:hypothetical protein
LKRPKLVEKPSLPSFSGSATVSGSMKKPGTWIMCYASPGVPVARADREAEPAIKFRPRVEVAKGVDNVIKTAGHGPRHCRTMT